MDTLKKYMRATNPMGDATAASMIKTKQGNQQTRQGVYKWRQRKDVFTDGKKIYMVIGEFK